MGRMTRSIFSLLLIVGLLAAGCVDDDGGDSAEATGTADGFDGTIVLGAAVSETGKYAREGEDTRQGYAIWLDWVNNEYGGIQVGDQRYRVELVMYDDESDPDTAANLVEKLITEDEVDFLLGPYSSGLTMAASATAEAYGMIMVEGNAPRNRSSSGASRTSSPC